jgi:predicted amidohydrolase
VPKLKVGVIQPYISHYNLEETLAKNDHLLSAIIRQGVTFVLSPEFFSTGTVVELHLLEYGIDMYPYVYECLTSRAKDWDVTITGACLVPDGEGLWNRFFLQEPDGTRAYRTKVERPAPETI